MKRNLWLSILILFFGVSAAGCSYLTMHPSIARFRVNNAPHEVKDIFVVLDFPLEKKLDIRLNNNHAIQFDFDFYSNTGTSYKMKSDSNSNESHPQLTPYIVWKYRF